MNEQIEAIRAEIERRMEKHWDLLPDADSPEDDWTHNELCELGAYKELEHLETFIDSQPEETAPKGYDEAYLNECIAKASKTWEGVDVDKYVDEVRGNRPKLSDNLDEVAQKVEDYYDVGEERGYLCCHRGDIKDAFVAGAKWQKEQMIKEAVAVEVVGEKRDLRLIDSTQRCLFNAERGDWIRIIIVKEDNQ